jgi:hypothetical protein
MKSLVVMDIENKCPTERQDVSHVIEHVLIPALKSLSPCSPFILASVEYVAENGTHNEKPARDDGNAPPWSRRQIHAVKVAGLVPTLYGALVLVAMRQLVFTFMSASFIFRADMSGINYDFTIEQGITFSKTVTWKDETGAVVNMTGMDAKMAIRTRDGLPIVEAICTVSGAAGQVVIGLTHLATAALDFDTAIYDLDILQGGVPIKRLLKGMVTLCKDVPDV